MRNGRFLLCLPLLTAASGCGFLFTHGPPTGHEQLEYIPCTESDAGPVVDLVWGGLNVLGAVIIAADPNAYENPEVAVASGVGWGVLSSFSAASGFKKSSACKGARQALAQRQAARGMAPLPIADSARVMSVVLTPAADTMAVGAQRQLVAVAHTSSGAMLADRMFTWSSSNDAIASVSNAGLVTARAPGSVVIAANTSNVVGTATILVTGQR
jgi:Bacterial Ig-like domain (group 2)